MERPIFGKVRYMADSGLHRKFDMDGYLRRVNALLVD
jgi:deoxyribodipyrimidine photo-lyase